MALGNLNRYLPGGLTGIRKSMPWTHYNEFTVGRDDYGHDVKLFGATTGVYWLWDESADSVIQPDNSKLVFGTGSDVTIYWDATNLIIAAAADDSLIEVGDSAVTQKSFDLKWYANEASGASYLYADASANLIYTVGVDLQFKDADLLVFGTGAGAAGDVSIVWDGTNLIINAVADDTLIEIGDSAVTQLSFDLKWYGNEASGASYLYADASANLIYTTGVDLQFKDSDYLVFGTGAGATGDINIAWDATNLVMASVAASSGWNIGAASFVINITQHGTFTVGVDDTGYDFKCFGATAGVSMLWDESADQLVITGNATVPALKLAGAGSFSPAAFATAGTAWADAGTPGFVADQKFLIVDYGGTLYRLPVWANA